MKYNKNLIYKILKNGGLFLILIVFTFYFIFRDLDIESVTKTILQINVLYLFPAVACMCIFILCEAINIKRNLTVLGYKTTLIKCINYSVNGFFFSAVTPSASGGQPMQVYQMHKNNIKISHSTLILFIQLLFFQIVTIMYSIIGLFTEYSLLSNNIGSIKYLLIIGLISNFVVLGFLLLVIFCNSTVNKIINVVIKFLKLCGFTKTESISEKLNSINKDYKEYSLFIIKNKIIIFKSFITVCIQIFALHSIPYWVYCSFGLNGYSILMFVGVQAVLFITVSALPLPGAVGASESGFLMLFKLFFPISILNEAMILSRGISFYLFILLSGAFLLIKWINDCKVYKEGMGYQKTKQAQSF